MESRLKSPADLASTASRCSAALMRCRQDRTRSSGEKSIDELSNNPERETRSTCLTEVARQHSVTMNVSSDHSTCPSRRLVTCLFLMAPCDETFNSTANNRMSLLTHPVVIRSQDIKILSYNVRSFIAVLSLCCFLITCVRTVQNNYVAANATYIRLLHGKIGFLEGFFGPSSVHRGRTHIVLGWNM